jgi:dihydroorotate dehydrogenase
MASRLPPGEAERRAKERARATWSGEKYKKVEAGNADQWAAIAAAFVNGDVTFIAEARAFTASASAAPKKKNPNPHLAALDLDEMPINLAGLNKGYRSAVMAAFRNADFRDTAPEYVAAFAIVTKAFDRLKLQKGW